MIAGLKAGRLEIGLKALVSSAINQKGVEPKIMTDSSRRDERRQLVSCEYRKKRTAGFPKSVGAYIISALDLSACPILELDDPIG